MSGKDAKIEKAKVNALDDGGPCEVGFENDKEKRKTDDDFGRSKQQRREPKFSSYTEFEGNSGEDLP